MRPKLILKKHCDRAQQCRVSFRHAYVLEQLGRDDQAAAESKRPFDYSQIRTSDYSYGAFLEKRGKLEEAVAQYREALQLIPGWLIAR